MSLRSSGWSVHYDLRPSKQASRMIMIDAMLNLACTEIDFSRYHYVGMGAHHFIDFRLIHRYLHVQTMTSLEHDEQFAQRCEYSAPYGSIEVFRGRAADYLTQMPQKVPMVVWLDFDWAICKDIVDDMYAVGSSIPLNSIFWATIKAAMPKDQEKLTNKDERFEYFSSAYPSFMPPSVGPESFNNQKLPAVIAKIFSNIFLGAFSGRDGKLFRISRLNYADGVEMITCGAALLDEKTFSEASQKLVKPYSWKSDTEDFFHIPDINLTSPERSLLDRAVTTNSEAIKKQARKLGFDDRFMGSYKQIYRFLPKYAEILP